jgi:hypothetical protein
VQQLQSVTLRVNSNSHTGPVGGRRLEGILARIVAPGRKLVASGVRKLELLAIGTSQTVSKGVEFESAGKGEGGDDIR